MLGRKRFVLKRILGLPPTISLTGHNEKEGCDGGGN